MAKLRFTFLLLLALSLPAAAQNGSDTATVASHMHLRHLVSAPVAPDSCDSARLEKKAFWRATAETVGFKGF